MSKQLETLLEKALKTGYANKNGRMRDCWGTGELESQYFIQYDENTDMLTLNHWGTNILILDGFKSENPKIEHVYGISKSDRDALMFIFCKIKGEFWASYKPSRGELHVFGTFVGKRKPELFII